MKPTANLLLKMTRDSGRLVISEFDIFLLAARLFQDRGYGETALPHKNGALTDRRARELISAVTWAESRYPFPTDPPKHALLRDTDFQSTLFRVSEEGSAKDVMLEADPFAALSHASALSFHGLQPEPKELHLCTPDRATWNSLARDYMAAADQYHPTEDRPQWPPIRLTRARPKACVRGQIVHFHELRRPIVAVCKGSSRAIAIGEAFRDTLDAPEWCGGISAVITIWRSHARAHLAPIIDAITASPEKILRVRAGYLLEEVLGIEDPRISAWLSATQRGSSRKLDSRAPYASTYSARWMLSINVDDPSLPSTTS